MARQKTGGRKVGTRNKRTVAREAIETGAITKIEALLKAAGIELSAVMPLEYALAVLRHPDSTSEERRWACEKAMPFCHARPGEASTQPTVAINGPSKVELVVIGSNEYNARYPDPARLLSVRAAGHS